MSSDRRLGTCVFAFCFVVLFTFILASGCSSGSGSKSSTSEPATPVSISIAPSVAAIAVGQSIRFTANVTGGSATLTWKATAGSIDSTGNYTAPSGTQSMRVTVTATSQSDSTAFAVATINVVVPGQVTATANPQVASYSISPAQSGKVSVQFGADTNYGLTTWTQPIPGGGGPVNLFVAGMRANTQYHLRGVVQFVDGSTYMDPDMTFTTQATPAAQLPVVTTTTTPGITPQSGVELLDLINFSSSSSNVAPVAVTDVNGNILWSYNPGLTGVNANPIKLLPNGHFLVNFSATFPDGGNSVLQEVDLTGKVVWQMTAADLNKALASATCAGCNITVVGTHHDFVMLPNGHLIVIAGTQQDISGTTVTGDVIIDLDQNHNPVWLWNEFDHLDTSRQPYMWPDWTHTNAILYSQDDGNLIISIRHQNWIIKIDYANGTGTGNILWHLGYQGDFTLVGGTDPTDWFYAQHGPSFTTANTTGQFGLAVFDNGDDRFFPSGQVLCTVPSASCYSSVPILQIDETAMTATLNFNPTAPFYSFFGGNNAILKNGNVEYCEAAEPTAIDGDVYEVTRSATPQTVWHMNIAGQYAYRGQRIPSMYPGVQW
jgi:arylsulfate sulfotransferase